MAIKWCEKQEVVIFTLLNIVTFVIVLPILLYSNPYSLYYLEYGTNSSTRIQEFNTVNSARVKASKEFLSQRISKGEGNIDMTRWKDANKINVMTTIITVHRHAHITSYEPRYLTQAVARYLQLWDLYKGRELNVGFIICDVGEKIYLEADEMDKYMRVSHFHEARQSLPDSDESYDKEKRDYAKCANSSLQYDPDFILLVEDDAYPRAKLFTILEELLTKRVPRVKEFAFIKLFHPQRLNSFITADINRWIELLGLVSVSTCIAVLVTNSGRRTSFCSWTVLGWFIYFLLLFMAIGRTNVESIRNIHPVLARLTYAPSCCTPANVYSRSGAEKMVYYMNKITCKKGFAKDSALESFAREFGLTAWFMEPNSFDHIGVYTTRRATLVDPKYVN